MFKNGKTNSGNERRGRAEKAIQGDGPDPSAAPPPRPPGRSPWLWPAPRTSPPPKRCSAPEAPPPSSPTPSAPCELSPTPGTRLSVWQRKGKELTAGSDGKIIALFSPRSCYSDVETCDCAKSLNVFWIFFFFRYERQCGNIRFGNLRVKQAKWMDYLIKGEKGGSVGSPGLQLADSGLKLLKPSISSFLSAHSFGYVFLLNHWKHRVNIFLC